MATQAQAQVPQPQASSPTIDGIVAAVKPVFLALLQAADKAGPVINHAINVSQKAWAAVQPYHPNDWLPIIFGIILIFFGGQFPVLIAAVEAFRICGWENTKRSIVLLWQQFQVASEASKKDDLVDADNDGIADVKQIKKQELVSRKITLFLRSTDPKALNEGIQGLTAGCSAVVATLRMHFAQTLTLGVSLGDVFTRTAETVLRPALEKALPREYHKWIGVGISYACRSVAVSIAWWCTRIISAIHSATRGAQLVLLGIQHLATRYNVHIPIDLSNANPLYPVVCGSVAAFGFWSQLSRGFRLPFPLNILLLPLNIIEWFLYYFLAYGK